MAIDFFGHNWKPLVKNIDAFKYLMSSMDLGDIKKVKYGCGYYFTDNLYWYDLDHRTYCERNPYAMRFSLEEREPLNLEEPDKTKIQTFIQRNS